MLSIGDLHAKDIPSHGGAVDIGRWRSSLNNILEPDHRAIEKRICAKQRLRGFDCAGRTIRGYKTIHKIRKTEVWLRRRDVRAENEFIDRIFRLTASILTWTSRAGVADNQYPFFVVHPALQHVRARESFVQSEACASRF